MSSETSGDAPLAYRLPLGGAWRRIRLDENAENDVKQLLDTAFIGIPDEAAEAARIALAQRFAAQITAARARSGLDLYVPADPVGRAGSGSPAPVATILAARVVIPAATAPDPVEVVARVAAANPAARTGIIAGTPAVRIDHTAAAAAAEAAADSGPGSGTDEDDDEAPRLQHIEYVMAVPDDAAHRWLSVALTAQEATGETVAEFDDAVAGLEF